MKVIGYVVDHYLPEVTEEDAHILDIINIAFGHVGKDYLLETGEIKHLETLKTIRKWNPDMKVVLSVGGWGAGRFSLMSRTEEGRRNFAASCAKYVAENGLDGIDIDWEYPCSDSANIDADPSDKWNFTFLLQALRDALGTDKTVSIAAGAGKYFPRDTEMDKVGAICDYVQLMTYDMRSGFCPQAGHHTAPYASEGDESGLDTKSITELFHAAGVPMEKLVIGAAFYSRRWTGVPDVNHGLFQKAGSIGMYGDGYTGLVEKYINKNGYTEYWDEKAQAPFLYNGDELISYDNERSIKAKCDYVKASGVMGIMYWEHSCDPKRYLLRVMGENKD